MAHIGIDIGTSGVKVVITGEKDQILASEGRSFKVSRPKPLWSEQNPELWWQGVAACLDQLKETCPSLLRDVRGIGLSGQMLGPVLIDRHNVPVRDTILWNDGRAVEEARRINELDPTIGKRVGTRPNPNFIAPKILWLRKHEPEVLKTTNCILLPKDYIVLKLTGERVTEPTDACGTHFMEAKTSTWAPDLLDLVGVKKNMLPKLIRPYEVAGVLKKDLAVRWGMSDKVPVAAGAGDNIAGAIGVGVGNQGDAVLSVGTSAVFSIVDEVYRPLPDQAVFTHPHAMPGTYLSMSVVLSATSCLDWAAELTARKPHELAREAEIVFRNHDVESAPIFLPYVNGIRTPHDMPEARGVITGLDLRTDVRKIGWSVLEGVAFHIVEGYLVQRNAGIEVNHLQFIGGGARSSLWGEMISTLIGMELHLPVGREVGASLGAARFAKVASGEMNLSELCCKPEVEATLSPNPDLKTMLEDRFSQFTNIFKRLKDLL